jgi:aspartate kinase
MYIIVQKFGGTSLAGIDKIRNVANKVKSEYSKGNKIIVVVSAMAGVTNQLDEYAREASPLISNESLAEYDSIISSGEQVTSGLLALILQSEGIKARSLLGWQAGIQTDGFHSKSKIEEINDKLILDLLDQGVIPVIAGFQGVSKQDRLTTMGRGGSDTTAVAIAAAVNADRCDIYTDVDGIYTADPGIVPEARRLSKIGYEEVIEMSSLGAKVLQSRAVSLAYKYNICLQVLSSFDNKEGTYLVKDETIMERRIITAVTDDTSEALITVIQLPNEIGISAELFKPFAEAEINIDMIIQNISQDNKHSNVSFTLHKNDLERGAHILEKNKSKLKYKSYLTNKDVTKISVIGVGMKTHSGVAQKMFTILADNQINILAITTSEIKISVLVEQKYSELAVRGLHKEFKLGN